MEKKIRLNMKQKNALKDFFKLDKTNLIVDMNVLLKKDWFLTEVYLLDKVQYRLDNDSALIIYIDKSFYKKLMKLKNIPKTNAFIVNQDYDGNRLIMQNILDDEDFEAYKNKYIEIAQEISDDGFSEKYEKLLEEVNAMGKLYNEDLIVIYSDSYIEVEYGLESIHIVDLC